MCPIKIFQVLFFCVLFHLKSIHTIIITPLQPQPLGHGTSECRSNNMSVTSSTNLDSQLNTTWGTPNSYPDGEAHDPHEHS